MAFSAATQLNIAVARKAVCGQNCSGVRQIAFPFVPVLPLLVRQWIAAVIFRGRFGSGHQDADTQAVTFMAYLCVAITQLNRSVSSTSTTSAGGAAEMQSSFKFASIKCCITGWG